MATINVREDTDDDVDQIQFGIDGDYISDNKDSTFIISDCHLYMDDIDYLIKALQKAKELWS